MKRILFLLIILTSFASCSSDDDSNSESENISEERQWTVTTKDKCEEDNETIYTKYCVTESMSESVEYEMLSNGAENRCDPITFQDIDDNEITAIVSSTGYSLGACDKIE